MVDKTSRKSTTARRVAEKVAPERAGPKAIQPPKPTAKSSTRMRPVDAATMARLIREGKVPPHYAVAKSEGDAAVQASRLPGWGKA